MKETFYRRAGIFTALFCLSISQAQADYNYSFGNSRVIQPGGNGLSNPSGTYIGGGTMSPSARGYSQTGPQVNPGLPGVPLGSHVGTPGDNHYGANPINTQQMNKRPGGNSPQAQGASTVYQPNNGMGLPGAALGAHIGTAGDGIRSDLNPNAYNSNQKFAWPVSRGAQAQQSGGSSDQPVIIIPQGGPASYGTNSPGAIHF